VPSNTFSLTQLNLHVRRIRTLRSMDTVEGKALSEDIYKLQSSGHLKNTNLTKSNTLMMIKTKIEATKLYIMCLRFRWHPNLTAAHPCVNYGFARWPTRKRNVNGPVLLVMFRLVSAYFSLFFLTEYCWISWNQPAFIPAELAKYLPCLLLLRGPKTQQKHGHHARDRQVRVQSRGCLMQKKKLL
jgi:hypothetical protein